MRQSDRIIVNILSNYGLSIVGGVASMALVPIVIGDLTQSGYGMAAMLLAAYAMVETLAGAISRSLQRYIPQDLASNDPSRVRATFSSAMVAYALLGLIAALAVWLARDVYIGDADLSAAHRQDGLRALIILCLALVCGMPLYAYRAGLESIQRYDAIAVRVGMATALRAVLLIALFKLGYGSATLFLVSYIVAIMGACLLCRRVLRRHVSGARESLSNIRRGLLWTLIVFAGANLLIIVGNILGNEGFRILVGVELGMNDVGGLSAVWTFRSMVFLLIRNMTGVLAPAVSSLDSLGSMENIAKLLLASTKYSVAAATSICVVPVLVAEPFLHLWLGENSVGLEKLMYVVLGAQVFVSLGGSAQQVMTGLGRLRFTGPAVLVRGGLALLTAGMFIRLVRPSLTGAAACLYCVLAAGHLVVFIHASHQTRSSILGNLVWGLGRPLVLGLAAAVVTWSVAQAVGADSWARLLLCVASGEIVFLGLMLTLGLSSEEKSRGWSFFNRGRARLAVLWAGSEPR